jgi:uncharacterized protein
MTDTTQTRVAIRPELDVSLDEIADFCRRHHIRWLALFGSVLRDDFTDESDVDVLVEFEPDQELGLRFFTIQDELATLVGRNVEMASPDELSRWIRTRVVREAEVIYDATR